MIPREDNASQDCCLVKVYEHVIEWGENRIDEIISEDDRYISSFYIKDYAEFLKTMWFCKENHVPVYFNENDNIIEQYNEKYDNPIFSEWINEIWVSIPTSESIMVINISI